MADESQTEEGAVGTGVSEGGEAGEARQKLGLEIKIDAKSDCERHVTITVPRADITRYFEETYVDLVPRADVPGFRVGKAPRRLVEKQFKDRVVEQVKGKLLMDSLSQVTAEGHFSAISEPDFDYDAIQLPDDGPMTFEFNIEVRPEFDMPEWKGMSVDRPEHKFSDEDVENRLARLLERYADLTPFDGPASANDAIVVNATFKHNGETISELKDETIRLRHELSFADAKLDGFDKLMVGAKAGEKRSAKIKLSEDSDREDLRGQELDVEFEVLDVKKMELPELTNEFLDRIGGFGDRAELVREVRGTMEKQFGFHQQRHVRTQVLGQLLKNAKWSLPPKVLQGQAKRELERMILELRSNGFTDEQIQQYANDLRRNSLKRTETLLKEHFILERIAEENQIEAGPEDYDQEIKLIAEQQEESPRKVRARLEKRGQMDTLRNQIVERKVLELVLENAKVKAVPFQPQRDDVEAVEFTIAQVAGQDIPEAKPGAVLEPLPGENDKKTNETPSYR